VSDANRATETVSNVLSDCESLDTFRYRNLGQYFMKPGDTEEISVRRLLYFVQSAQVTIVPVLLIFYSIVFYFILF
jgi:hypothetical protein